MHAEAGPTQCLVAGCGDCDVTMKPSAMTQTIGVRVCLVVQVSKIFILIVL